ncbi:molybdopterin molybdenumtransferase MoeA [Paracoccus aestuarii]|uniref:Molybdopterin molybdenumtransferase n=1 Tax=Paracoccus aestuarii TaxID=453842 RepID=A0A418ZU59_9RHOB|nr:gephyrin-like molybdotransferase Glp [Paracoccus aestuarii]RJL02286.1 molybdopterin molybdenumtransferase MoeA [Paracoccus aestuarii]WCQ98239.1 molybdopterin molybdotransferase MoeA [Paracoccus aestuarii]
MIAVDDALSLVLALAGPPRPETLPLAEAAGRVLLQPVRARLTQPPFDASAMDGYAMRTADLPGPLRVIGTSAAGHPWDGSASPGTAIRIFTGAPVPAGYDHVELQENVDLAEGSITVRDRSNGSNIRAQGNDFAEGDEIAGGQVLTPALIGLLAAMNIAEVTVARAPRVAILAGGDELVPPGADPRPGQIISSNDLAIAALARACGAEVTVLPLARDDEAELQDRFKAARGCDLLVTIGGASVGDHDLIGKVAAEQGIEQSFYKVRMRPGKPLMAGRMADLAMLGLPGNPVSAMVCGLIFMQPLIRAMQGLAPGEALAKARLAEDIGPEGPRQHYLRARVHPGPDLPLITPFADQDSARLSLMAQAGGLLVRPAGDPARRAGELVDYLPLPGGN